MVAAQASAPRKPPGQISLGSSATSRLPSLRRDSGGQVDGKDADAVGRTRPVVSHHPERTRVIRCFDTRAAKDLACSVKKLDAVNHLNPFPHKPAMQRVADLLLPTGDRLRRSTHRRNVARGRHRCLLRFALPSASGAHFSALMTLLVQPCKTSATGCARRNSALGAATYIYVRQTSINPGLSM